MVRKRVISAVLLPRLSRDACVGLRQGRHRLAVRSCAGSYAEAPRATVSWPQAPVYSARRANKSRRSSAVGPSWPDLIVSDTLSRQRGAELGCVLRGYVANSTPSDRCTRPRQGQGDTTYLWAGSRKPVFCDRKPGFLRHCPQSRPTSPADCANSAVTFSLNAFARFLEITLIQVVKHLSDALSGNSPCEYVQVGHSLEKRIQIAFQRRVVTLPQPPVDRS